ncbi:hypothetical protein ABVK25_002655 [Lepraria finkii]|uniref:Uncharacterized protein n=1 Tax=Lepraria finkii TaxID=1340010 RepID=A0ABR4BIQ0_9LECA
MTASGDPTSQQTLSNLLQPNGGRFISTRAAEKPEFSENAQWWYTTHLLKAIAGAIEPTPIEKRSGGLKAIQAATEDLLSGNAKSKIIMNPQE